MRAEEVSQSCDLLLAVGTSLAVYPIASVVPIAHDHGARIVILNAEPTEMDDLAHAVVRGSISELLPGHGGSASLSDCRFDEPLCGLREISVLDELDTQQRMNLLKFVCSFAWADLEIRPAERAFVSRFAESTGAQTAQRPARCAAGSNLRPAEDELDPHLIPLHHREIFIETVKGVIRVDGEIAPEELESLELLSELLGWETLRRRRAGALSRHLTAQDARSSLEARDAAIGQARGLGQSKARGCREHQSLGRRPGRCGGRCSRRPGARPHGFAAHCRFARPCVLQGAARAAPQAGLPMLADETALGDAELWACHGQRLRRRAPGTVGPRFDRPGDGR